MTLIVTPSLINLDEYSSNTTTFTLSDNDAIDDVGLYFFQFYSFTGAVNSTSSFNVQNVNPTINPVNFTVIMNLNDIFNRQIGYVANNAPAVTNSFANLPSTYQALYKYIPDPNQYLPMYFNVNCYWGTSPITTSTLPNTVLQVEYYVRQNWQLSRAQFETAVSNGQYTKAAAAAGYGGN